MKENTLKMILVAAWGALSAYFGQIMVPLLVMTAVVLMDYITGMVKAWERKELSSRVGLQGILKKLGYYIMVAVAMAIDYFIRYEMANAGITYDFDFMVSSILIIWLSINECISILENLAAIGVPVPGWLLKLIEKLKAKTEEATGAEDDKEVE